MDNIESELECTASREDVVPYIRVLTGAILVALKDYKWGVGFRKKTKRYINETDAQNIEHAKSAEQWFFSPSTRPFSFIWMCTILGIDYRRARSVLLEMQGETS